MSDKNKIILFYISILTSLIGLVLLNFFHVQIIKEFEYIPAFVIPMISGIFIIVTILSFWKRESLLEYSEYEFLTIVTHKFRTPLVSIKWVMDELEKGNIPRSEMKELVKDTKGSVLKLMEIVDYLAGIARSDSRLAYSFEKTNFRKMLDVSLEKFSKLIREKKLNFKIAADKRIPTILADFQKIQFVVDTLLENAIRYTPEEGTIYVKLSLQKKFLIFAVQDTGIGMSKDEMKRVFKKFFRSDSSRKVDPEGLGLALYMSKIVIKEHKGSLWVESLGLGKGSTFYMKLKVSK